MPKIMSKKILIPIIIVLVLIIVLSQTIFKKEESNFTLAEAVYGNVSQEISETGQVKKGDGITLSFKNGGRIETIYVAVGQVVGVGESLARLDTADLYIQLQEANSALAIYQAKLDKLMTGASQEEIKVAQTAVENYEIALNTARQNLNDAYEDALNTLDSAYLNSYNAFNVTDSIQMDYFTANDQESIRVKENKNKIETALKEIKEKVNKAKTDVQNEYISTALSETKNELNVIYNSLGIIRETCEELNYRNSVSSTDKTSLDTQRTNINTALTNLVNAQQTIISKKLSIQSAEGQVQSAKDELNLLTASPRQEDIDLYSAQVAQAQASADLLTNKIQEATLRSPVKGQIAKINNKKGELVQLTTKVISLIPEEPFQVEVEIPEVSIGKIEPGDLCRITLDAFPEDEFLGKVMEIEPAETIIQGVVYYKIKVSVEEQDSEIKPGMTANVVIVSETRENVLIIPQRAITEKEGKKIVRLPEKDNYQEREIETGLRGSAGEIEIISGLKEGDKVITFIKEK